MFGLCFILSSLSVSSKSMNNDKCSIDELVYGTPLKGPYQTNLPSPDDIISYIREDREGQVTRIRHQEEVEVTKQARLILPYGMLLTRLFDFIIDENPKLQNESYVLYDRVMYPLASPLERKPRRDRGTTRGCHSTSFSTFNQPSSSHLNDDDDDKYNEWTSRASTPSPIRDLILSSSSHLPSLSNARKEHSYSSRNEVLISGLSSLLLSVLLAKVIEEYLGPKMSTFEGLLKDSGLIVSKIMIVRGDELGDKDTDEDGEDESSNANDKGHGSYDEGHGLDDKGRSVDSYGLGLGEEEEEAIPEGLQQAASTPLSLEWSSGSLLVSPSSPVVPSPIALPVATSKATISVDEDQFLEEMRGRVPALEQEMGRREP
nr:hypothetical protein [Tanacetum cinerariifolium]